MAIEAVSMWAAEERRYVGRELRHARGAQQAVAPDGSVSWEEAKGGSQPWDGQDTESRPVDERIKPETGGRE